MWNILVTEPKVYCEECLSILGELGNVVSREMSRAELLDSINTFAILMVGLETRADRELLERANALRIIGSPTTGLDHIDTSYARQKGIKIVSLKGEREFLEGVNASVEHTFALLLSLVRKIPWAFDSVRNEKWVRNKFFGTELNGKTLGIIGLGRIGTKVSKVAKSFGMKVVAFDPYTDTGRVRLADLDSLLEEADIISINAELTPETENMISSREFELMRRKPILVNTARGKIVNEDALLNALEKGLISGAAVDVLSNEVTSDEPLKDNPLVSYARQNDNLIITPHLGGATCESMKATQIYIAQRIKEVINRSSSRECDCKDGGDYD